MKVIACPSSPLKDASWEPVAPDRLISGAPKTAYHILHTSSSGEFTSGVYECTPGKWHVSYAEDEFCTLLEGHVRLTNQQGESQDFKAPDSFLIPSGYVGTWEAVTKVRKLFVIYEKENAKEEQRA